jgi:hypothetical protein
MESQSQDKINPALSFIQGALCSNYSDEELFQALQLAQKILQNIVKNPKEQKFKSVKKSNATLKAKLFYVSEMEGFFEALGFNRVDDALVFTGENFRLLDTAATALENQIERIRDRHLTKADREAMEKEKLLAERRKQLEADLQKKHEEERKLKEMMECDKKEQIKREKAKDAKAQDREFGASTKTWKDIGVNLNAQPKK